MKENKAKPKLWSKEELRELKRIWPNGDSVDVQVAIGAAEGPFRTWEAIRKMASRLGLRKTRRYRREVLHRKD